MIRKLVLMVFLFSLPSLALAQVHSNTLTWGASAAAGVGYHVCKAPCTAWSATTCTSAGAWIVIASTTTLGYVDKSVTSGAANIYQITAYCDATTSCSANSGESTPTSSVLAITPKDAPPSPGSLNIVSN